MLRATTVRNTRPLRVIPVTKRCFSYSQSAFVSLKPSPAPPRLPKKDQEEFERLQKLANSQPDFVEGSTDSKMDSMMHPQFRKVYADFEGDVNPETGEVGGPKQDPLRHGDYSFNGRVTDF